MQTFTVQHITIYRYRNPVAFGEHRMMFRPREDVDLKLLESELKISPAPASLRVIHDALGNHVQVARFSGLSPELRFTSTFRVEHAARGLTGFEIDSRANRYPFTYPSDEIRDLSGFIERQEPDPSHALGRWARRFVPSKEPVGTFELLRCITRGIHDEFKYRRRDTKGIQSALETLRLRSGTCRDFAILMIEASRSLGFAARFASGYLAVPLDYSEERAPGASHGATHAWSQIYLPGAGWIDFDPTSGKIGKHELIPVAVVRDPRHAIPLHGTFIGEASDFLGMEVEVNIRQDERRVTPRALPRAV